MVGTVSGTNMDGITLTFRSIMAGSEPFTVTVRRDSTVRDLRYIYQDKVGCSSHTIIFSFNGKELSNDDSTIEEAGISDRAIIYVSARVESGLVERASSTVLVQEGVLQQHLDALSKLQGVRAAIRGMHNMRGRNGIADAPLDLNHNKAEALWTPEKQMEHQVTRNRMKDLLKRRREAKATANPSAYPNSSAVPSSGYRDTGSVGVSPMGSEPGTPISEMMTGQSLTSISSGANYSKTEVVEPGEIRLTEKEMKLFFDPPETHREMVVLQQDLYDPPRNREELTQIRKDLKAKRKTICGICRKKLPISQQNMVCACGRSFCSNHRNPEDHQCTMDYKLTGRKKLHKENPKVDGGGAHKARISETQ